METVNDIINLVAKRDGISFLEASNLVEECIDEMQSAINRGNYFEAEDILASYLGLEPDYLDILMTEMW